MESEKYLSREKNPVSNHFKKMQRLITEYSITSDIHVSRTLDQSYYETMESTTDRDYDQVVYRYTRDNKAWATGQNSAFNLDHKDGVYDKLPQEEQKTNARILMVNQLWLWKIDESTSVASCQSMC